MPEYSIDLIGRMLQAMSDRQDRIEAKIDRLDARLVALDQRLKANESLTESLIDQVGGLEDRLTKRLDRLEHAIGLQSAP